MPKLGEENVGNRRSGELKVCFKGMEGGLKLLATVAVQEGAAEQRGYC